jgi:hypothetical protein
VLTETLVGGIAIPEAVPVEGVLPETEVLAEEALEPRVIVAPETTDEVREDALPESSMDVVIRSLEIQDTEPIRLSPM